jgi:hypothetical protein
VVSAATGIYPVTLTWVRPVHPPQCTPCHIPGLFFGGGALGRPESDESSDPGLGPWPRVRGSGVHTAAVSAGAGTTGASAGTISTGAGATGASAGPRVGLVAGISEVSAPQPPSCRVTDEIDLLDSNGEGIDHIK